MIDFRQFGFKSLGIKNEGACMKKIIAAVLLSIGLTGCSPSESIEEKLAKATTPSEVVEAVAYKSPAKAYTVEETAYMAVIFEGDSTRDYALLKAKELMPVLLERYPEVNRFFIAWANDGKQFLKIQFERDQVQHADWEVLNVKKGEVQALASMYWAAPRLR